ncbi:SulP family inorganic anion transporter [Alphaproteobacteria bacterium LMG 31809]|uniref:SulP family inorganic anion transporter n=1 Tax=Govanella unica TaxID=2975056 RepID=A0A9X3TXJ8_9PROT|nr:SulP family inorganic anion transporter [Govania unica]
MDRFSKKPQSQPRPSFVELFTPKLVTVLREGYRFDDFRADVIAGLVVAIVALPLSMAIAVASGATPDRGLYTAIVGGFLISVLGGSRFQIGGPAGAFIILVAATVDRHGIDGLLLATMMAGAIMMIGGYLRLGTYIKFIPYPVTVGFTAGIAVIIFVSQLKDFFGLSLPGKEPGAIIPKLEMLWASSDSVNSVALAVALGTIVIIAGLKKWRPSWPGMLIAVVLAALAGALLQLPIDSIGSRFGGIPQGLPMPRLPEFSLVKMQALLPDAVAFALLGSIESLLSAVVADGMTGRRHRSNCELVAQGAANIGSALFGGICATGTIARTATNVRAGGRTPIAGILHAVFLLSFIIVAAPLASYIPLAALAGILVVIAWNMAEKHEFMTLAQSSRGDLVVVLVTFLLTVFRDLTEAIVVGFALGAVLFIHRMTQVAAIETELPPALDDVADRASGDRSHYDGHLATDPDVVIYRISGAFFFGTAAAIGAALDRIGDQRNAVVIDFSAVPFVDSTAANTIAGVARSAHKHGVPIYITTASPTVQQLLMQHGVSGPGINYRKSVAEAVAEAKSAVREHGISAAPAP